MPWEITVRFNSRLKGSGQELTRTYDTDDPIKALDAALIEPVRLPEHGQSVYIMGFTGTWQNPPLEDNNDQEL